MIKKHLTLMAVLCMGASLVVAQHTGKVFVDSNGNGIYDKGEKLLSNVSVSDGLNVVKTANDGSYTLAGHTKERFVFITTPSGYKTYNSYYQKIASNQAEYNFGVIPYNNGLQKDGTHKFIHLSDTEIGETETHDDWIANIRDYTGQEKVAFVMHTGDICYIPGLNSHIQIMNSENMMNTQVFYSVGNHDLVAGDYGEQLFENLYGPTFYSFDVGNVHYLVTPMLGGDHWPSYRKKDIYEWMKNDLELVAKDKTVIMFTHSISDDTKDFKYGVSDTEYVDLLKYNLKGWFYGHWHVNHIHQHKSNNVKSVCTSSPIRGGIDHASSAFRVLTVQPDGDFVSDFRYSYINKSIKIASIQNSHAPILPNGTIPLSVNAYTSAYPVASVKYICYWDGKPIGITKQLEQKTDFNWYGELALSEQYDGKYITVEVVANFVNGEIAKTRESFKYERKQYNAMKLGADWTNMLGSVQHVVALKDTLKYPLQLNWVKNIESNIFMSAPLIYQNSVFVASIDDNETGKAAVVKLNALTGKQVWKRFVNASIRSSMAITDGIVFAQDVHGMLYAIDTNSGKIIWTKDLEIGMVPPLNDGLIATEGRVYAGTGKSLFALEAKTGKEIWRNQDWNRGEGCTTTLSLNNDILVGHANWGGLYANDAQTGKMIWGTGDGELRHRASSAAMYNGVFYLLSDQSFFVMDSQSGRILVRKKLGYNVNVTSTPLVTKSEIIFGTSERGIIALDRETLNEKWNFKTNPAMIYTAPYIRNPAATVESSPVLVGETVIVGASDGNIYGINHKTGRQEWKHATGAPILTSVAISGNAMYAVDFSGNVYGFSSKSDD